MKIKMYLSNMNINNNTDLYHIIIKKNINNNDLYHIIIKNEY